jgi:hypothetical protein
MEENEKERESKNEKRTLWRVKSGAETVIGGEKGEK